MQFWSFFLSLKFYLNIETLLDPECVLRTTQIYLVFSFQVSPRYNLNIFQSQSAMNHPQSWSCP